MNLIAPAFPFDPFYLLRLRRRVKTESVTIVHAHQVLDAAYALLATAGMPVKIVLSLHGHGIGDGWLAKVLRRIAIVGSDRVLFVSKRQQRHYTERYGPIMRGRILHNGLDFKKIQASPGDELSKQLSLEPDTLLLGAVGNFTSGRDQLTICRFLRLLNEQQIPFHFVFIGAASAAEPTRYDDCVRYCAEHGLADRVSFLGSRSDVPTLLPQLDAFVYSTVHDTFGIAVVEAIAAGIPVFVNDWEVMHEITNGGEWAILYQSRSETDLLEKFLDFWQHQPEYHENARRNAASVRARYGIENYLTNLKKIYTELLAPAH